MLFVLHEIEKAKEDIELAQKKIEREKLEHQENWELVVKMAERQIQKYQTKIKREQVEKHKLLSHENEIIREAANRCIKNI